MFGAGDCQVLSSMGAMAGASMAGGSASDALFAPPLLPGNATLGFMSAMPPFRPFAAAFHHREEGAVAAKEEEMESGSGSGHFDGLLSFAEDDEPAEHKPEAAHLEQEREQEQSQPPAKKKRYHRHTTHQIQEMEALFKECPHPDEKQRLKLSQDLGLKPRQVKFWFQNRRTQLKAQQDRTDNVLLRTENENLKSENFRLQAAIRNVVCPGCGHAAVLGEMGFEEQQLRIENARLKEELDRLACFASQYSGRQAGMSALGPMPPLPLMLQPVDLGMGIYSRHFAEHPVMGFSDLIAGEALEHHPAYAGAMAPISEHDKQLALDLAVAAADQLARMCHAAKPLWVRRGHGADACEVLDAAEYARTFRWPIAGKPEDGASRTEGTRDSAVVIMNSVTLVDAFLNANKWMELFPSIVSKARTVQVISHGGVSGNFGNGSLLLMQAEVQFLTPLVAAREIVFFRYCAHNLEEGTWAIVDFPTDGFQDGIQISAARCRRRPSGCIIQDMPNGYSRVVWVEHTEVGEEKKLHHVFRDYVSSGAAFGATRWVSVLQRQCERLASELARNISDHGVISTPEARTNIMRLSQRMIATFCANIGASGSQSWTALSDSPEDTIRVTTLKNTEPGQPSGVILTAVSTNWLPFTHQQVFELLADEQRRCQLDILSSGSSLHEVAHIANGSHPRNCISLLRINAASNSSQNVELLLQESSTHPSGGSLVVCATVDVEAIQVVMSGEDQSYIPLLPMGFAISPAANPAPTTSGASPGDIGAAPANAEDPVIGCLLTVGMQVVASAVPSARLNLSSVHSINNSICNAVRQITAALKGGPSRAELAPAGSGQ